MLADNRRRPLVLKHAFKSMLAIILFVVTFQSTAGSSTAQDRTTVRKRVVFEKGRTSTVIKNTIRKGTNHHYLLRAREGQTMIIHLVAKQSGLTVYTPNEGPAIEAADGVMDWEGTLPETGEYIIEVATDARMAPYTLEITIR